MLFTVAVGVVVLHSLYEAYFVDSPISQVSVYPLDVVANQFLNLTAAYVQLRLESESSAKRQYLADRLFEDR